jgi:ribosomal protein L16/L10AE
MLIKKEKRLHLKLKKKKHDKLIYGTVGIQALQTGEITREQLETIRRFLMRNFNKQCLY